MEASSAQYPDDERRTAVTLRVRVRPPLPARRERTGARRAFLTSTFERETPEAVAFRVRAESLPFATLVPVRNDSTARLRAAAKALDVPAYVLAERLAGCPDCRAFVVWGEVPRA